jgi:hypothetical protein
MAHKYSVTRVVSNARSLFRLEPNNHINESPAAFYVDSMKASSTRVLKTTG